MTASRVFEDQVEPINIKSYNDDDAVWILLVLTFSIASNTLCVILGSSSSLPSNKTSAARSRIQPGINKVALVPSFSGKG